MFFGETIRILREERGIPREVFAKMLALSLWTLNKIETNHRYPDYATLSKIAYFLGAGEYVVTLPVDKTDNSLKMSRWEYFLQWQSVIEAWIGQRVKQERQSRGWTQKYVAQQIGFPDSDYISRIENGKRPISPPKLRAFAKLFNVSLDYFIFGHIGDGY